MLNNSSDAYGKVNDKESQKNIDNHAEGLKTNVEASDFIPLDKDVPSVKTPLKQRERGQQKSYYHKTSYYNSNRYQNRGTLHGNSVTATYKTGSNTLRGQHLKNTHINYVGSGVNSSYQNVNGASNYRTKRKRDSSAISAHGRNGKNQGKNGNIVNTNLDASAESTISCKSLTASAIKDYQSKHEVTSKPHSVSPQIEASGCVHESQAAFTKERCNNDQGTSIQHVQRNIVKTNNKEAFTINQECSKRHQKYTEPQDHSNNDEEIDCSQAHTGGDAPDKKNSSVSINAYGHVSNELNSRSQENVYLKSKEPLKFHTTLTNSANKENAKTKSYSPYIVTSPADGLRDKYQYSCSSPATGEQPPVWYRGKPYGGGAIG